jgi:hypothetical protein
MSPKRGSDEGGFDVHQTDPARLGIFDYGKTGNNPRPKPDPISGYQSDADYKAEVKKDLGLDKAKPEWECTQCDYEHYSMKKPHQCPKCGAYGSFKKI